MTAAVSQEAASTGRRAALLAALDGCKINKPHKRSAMRTVIPFHSDGKHVTGRAWSMCEKKRGYESRRLCERIIKDIYADRGVRLRYYFCDRCRKYHITKCIREGE